MKAAENLIRKEIIGIVMSMGCFDVDKKLHFISFDEIRLKGLYGENYTTSLVDGIEYAEETDDVLLVSLSSRSSGFHFYLEELTQESLVDLCEAIHGKYPFAFVDFEFEDYRYALDMFGRKIKVGDTVGFKDETGLAVLGTVDTISQNNLLTFTNVRRLKRSSSSVYSICGNIKEIVEEDEKYISISYKKPSYDTVIVETS